MDWLGGGDPGRELAGKTKAELLRNLRSALREALDMNREEALSLAGEDYEEALLKA